jgi:two-component system response regulator DesR
VTARELLVLRCAAEGATVTEIAARLFLSAGTVRNYLSASIRKSGARNRIDAIRIAREAGWI